MNEEISSRLQISLHSNETIPSAKRAESSITDVSEAICKIYSKITDLTQFRDKCRIHIQQYESDYNALLHMYGAMKERLMNPLDDDDVDFVPAEEEEKNKKITPTTKNPTNSIQPTAPANIVSKEKALEVREMTPVEPSQMSIVDIPWHVSPNNNYKLKLRFALSTPAVLCSVQFDPQGRCIAFSDGRLLHIITTENGALMYSIEIPRSINRNELHTRVIRFSPDGRLIALSSMSSSISIFSTETRKCLGSLEGHKKTVSSLLFLKGSRLISGSYDGVLCIWDVQKMSLSRLIQHGAESNGKLNKEGAIVSLATDPDESFIAVGFMKGYVGIYEPTFTQPMNTFSAHSEYLLCVETLINESAIITTSHDKTAKLWMLRGVASCKHVFKGHRDYVISATISKTSNLMITGSKDETLKGWNRDTGEELFTIVGHKNTLFEVHHHPTENAFVSCSGDGLVCMWEYSLPK